MEPKAWKIQVRLKKDGNHVVLTTVKAADNIITRESDLLDDDLPISYIVENHLHNAIKTYQLRTRTGDYAKE